MGHLYRLPISPGHRSIVVVEWQNVVLVERDIEVTLAKIGRYSISAHTEHPSRAWQSHTFSTAFSGVENAEASA